MELFLKRSSKLSASVKITYGESAINVLRTVRLAFELEVGLELGWPMFTLIN